MGRVAVLLLGLAVLFLGCDGGAGASAPPSGDVGVHCTARENADGSFTVSCPDGSVVTWTGEPLAPPTAGGCDPSQSVFRGSLSLAAPADLWRLACVTVVEGDLRVKDSTNLVDLVLPGLAAVHGDLLIQRNGALTRLELPLLASVGGDLEIYGNAKLSHLALPALGATVNGDLLIEDNSALENLDLPSLGRVEQRATIAGPPAPARVRLISNPRLAAVALPDLTEGKLNVERCPSLAEIDLPRLAHGGLVATNCAALARVALPALESGRVAVLGGTALSALSAPLFREGNVAVLANEKLTRLDLPAFRSGGVRIINNPLLTHVDLPELLHVSELAVHGNPVLEALSLPALDFVEWNPFGFSLRIENNDALEELSLPALITLSGGMSVMGNAKLADLTLAELRDASGWQPEYSGLHISENPSLAAITLPKLETISALDIIHNVALTEFNAPMLREASWFFQEGGLTLRHNPMLETLVLDGLTQAASLTVEDHERLHTVGLSALAVVRRDVRIRRNSTLRTLLMPVLTELGATLHVTDNPKLCGSIPEAIAAALEEAGFEGEIDVARNDDC